MFPPVEAIERQAIFLALTVAIVLAFDTANFVTQLGKGWEVTVYILGLVALGAAAALLAFAVAPRALATFTRELRERLLFVAFALVTAAILQIALLRAYETYWAHRHGPQF